MVMSDNAFINNYLLPIPPVPKVRHHHLNIALDPGSGKRPDRASFGVDTAHRPGYIAIRFWGPEVITQSGGAV